MADIKVTVNGEPVAFSGVGPQKIQGRVMVPLRGVMEKIGAFVGWDAPTKTVRAQKGNIDLSMVLGASTATVNGKTVALDVPAQQILGVTMVPLRFMGETLGAEITWEAATETIHIKLPDSSGTTTTTTNPPVTVEIRGFDVKAPEWIKAGDVVQFTLTGSAGCAASVIINGVPNEIPLKEQASGVYTGTWQPATDKPTSLLKTTALGKLRSGTTEKLIQGAGTLSIDTLPPTIRVTSPADGSTVNTALPEITATFSDEGSGIDKSKIRLLVGTANVTTAASIHTEFLLYRPAKAYTGTQSVTVEVCDAAGNKTTRTWSFKVEPKAPNTAPGPAIKLFTQSAREGATVGQPIDFRVDTIPGATVKITAGKPIQALALQETPAGVYRGSYVVKAGDIFANETVYADVTVPGGQTYRVTCTEKIPSVKSAPAVALAITSHKATDTVSGTLTLKGTAPIGSKVSVRVEYATSVTLLRLTGLVTEETVEVDAKGNWTTSEMNLDTLVKGKDTEYRITVVSEDSEGKKSNPVTLTLKKG